MFCMFDESGLRRCTTKNRLYSLKKVNQPLVLISQVQRSGGTLLSQLFDGHQELFSYPAELHWGYPSRFFWPLIEPHSSPGSIYRQLWANPNKLFLSLRRNGYSKQRTNKIDAQEKMAMIVDQRLAKEVFLDEIRKNRRTARSVFNAFFTAFFGSWIDYQNYYNGEKLFVTAFTPRVAIDENSVNNFFSEYPEGYILSLVRHPRDWFESMRRHKTSYDFVDKAVDTWMESALASRRGSIRWPQMKVVVFEDLVSDTPRVMRYLASELGITWDQSLEMPTYNGMQIFSDSSYRPTKGIDKSTLTRAKNKFDTNTSEGSPWADSISLYHEIRKAFHEEMDRSAEAVPSGR